MGGFVKKDFYYALDDMVREENKNKKIKTSFAMVTLELYNFPATDVCTCMYVHMHMSGHICRVATRPHVH